MRTMMTDEIAKAKQLARAMIDEYVAWRGKLAYGKTLHAMYMDMLDFVNFRIETADSCLLLAENRKVADALGLCRALFENYLLLMLMCRGTKFFRLEELTSLRPAEFKVRLERKQAEIRRLHTEGKTPCLAVESYPRERLHLMYVFEGLRSPDVPGFLIPMHFFLFRDFRPETLRLKDEDYFQYYEHSAETKKAIRGHRATAKHQYRNYLSYDSLLQCLELNDLADSAVLARIEAHYTFLGQFLHPTNDAARYLHEHANVHDGKTRVGLDQAYTETAMLLACTYICYILAAILDEVAGLFEQAPGKYMANPGTTDLRAVTARVPTEFPYFWFLFNDLPFYDRFIYCIHHATDKELAAWGSYEHVPLERVPFNQHIYDHLKHALTGYQNIRCGEYRSPLL